MIIFTTNPSIVTQEFLDFYKIDYVRGYNLTSYLNMFPTLTHLSPNKEQLGCEYEDDANFNVCYTRYLGSDFNVLSDLYSIMDVSYNHSGLCIVTVDYSSSYRCVINEAVASYINYRYQCNVYFCESEEDLWNTQNRDEIGYDGLINLSRDSALIASRVMQTMSVEDIEDIVGGT